MGTPAAPIPGWQKLLDDVQAVEDRFKDPTFNGVHDQGQWGSHREGTDHSPSAENYCGTAACLAGWLGLLGKHEFRAGWADGELEAAIPSGSFVAQAVQVYGLSQYNACKLFEARPRTLDDKLHEAREMAKGMRDAEGG